MAVFDTQTFDFYYYDSYNKDHAKLLSELTTDPDVKQYVDGITNYLLATSSSDLERAYLVGDKTGNLIGYLKLFYFRHYGLDILDLHYAIAKDYRGIRDIKRESIGCKMLRESTNYLLETRKEIELIEILIDKTNIRSIKAAIHAGFTPYNNWLYRKTIPTEYNQNSLLK